MLSPELRGKIEREAMSRQHKMKTRTKEISPISLPSRRSGIVRRGKTAERFTLRSAFLRSSSAHSLYMSPMQASRLTKSLNSRMRRSPGQMQVHSWSSFRMFRCTAGSSHTGACATASHAARAPPPENDAQHFAYQKHGCGASSSNTRHFRREEQCI